MFFENTKEDKFTKNEKLFNELSIRIEKLDTDIENFLEELQLTPEQLSQFIDNRENFTDENWELLNQKRRELDEKLQCDLACVLDPKKAKKAYSELNATSTWIHVR